MSKIAHLEREEVIAELVGAPEGDHVRGLNLPILLLGLVLAVQQADRLAGLHLPEACHHQLLVQVPGEHVSLPPCQYCIY